MQNLIISSTAIRQIDGLFSLNDLHKAAGGEEKHRPNQFIRADTTQGLIAEIETAQMCAVKTKEGRKGGTYACRELVIANRLCYYQNLATGKPATVTWASPLQQTVNENPLASR